MAFYGSLPLSIPPLVCSFVVGFDALPLFFLKSSQLLAKKKQPMRRSLVFFFFFLLKPSCVFDALPFSTSNVPPFPRTSSSIFFFFF